MRNFIVTIDGKSFSVGVEEVGESESVIEAPVVKQAATTVTKPVSSAPVNGEKVVSPFPGLIKNLLVEEGATVKKDQPIMVLEAMKMDNDITSPCDGKVSFRVTKGANVETNAILAVIG
jgi:biotin carboxyl carrier protein